MLLRKKSTQLNNKLKSLNNNGFGNSKKHSQISESFMLKYTQKLIDLMSFTKFSFIIYKNHQLI